MWKSTFLTGGGGGKTQSQYWECPCRKDVSMAMDCPWPWTVHGHGQSMAMDCPGPWTVHGHGQSKAMDRWGRGQGSSTVVVGEGPGVIDCRVLSLWTKARRLLYKLTTPRLYKLTTPLTIQAYHAVDYTSLPHR